MHPGNQRPQREAHQRFMNRVLYGTVPTNLPSNKLLAALPSAEQDVLRPHATLVSLDRRDILYQPQRTIEAVYFPIDGIVSLLSVMDDGNGVETATIGREGMVGMAVFHGVASTAEQAMMQ